MDTQEIEGANSVLQAMAKAAPRMTLPLASDRMRIKKGDPIMPIDAAALNHRVLEWQKSSNFQHRFAIVPCEAVEQQAIIFISQ